jgi:hypothetical protein
MHLLWTQGRTKPKHFAKTRQSSTKTSLTEMAGLRFFGVGGIEGGTMIFFFVVVEIAAGVFDD